MNALSVRCALCAGHGHEVDTDTTPAVPGTVVISVLKPDGTAGRSLGALCAACVRQGVAKFAQRPAPEKA